MPKNLTRYTVLLSSPGDAVPLCEAADRAMQAVNRSLSDETGVELYPTDWRRDSRADSGAEPQALLNRQIVDGADVVLAIFFRSFGSPTSQYGSGTEEEIRLGLQQKKMILLYIWEPSENYEPIESDQFASIQRLKADLGKSVMYKSFSDESDLEAKVRHDLTRLVLDLEGGGRPPKPALSLKCIDVSGSLVSKGLRIQKEFVKNKLSADSIDDSVRKAFEKVAASPVRKPDPVEPSYSEPEDNAARDSGASDISGSMAFTELYPGIAAAVSQMGQIQKPFIDSYALGLMNSGPIEFEEGEMSMAFEQLAGLGIEPPEDLFYVGLLRATTAFASICGPGRTLEGTDNEKAKYDALKSLVKECRLRRDYQVFLNSFAGIDCIALVLANDGGQPATHVSVEVLIPTDTLVPHNVAPVPSDYLIGHLLDDGERLGRFVKNLYAIEGLPTYRTYDASQVMYESGGKIAPFHQRFDSSIYGRCEFNQDDFSDEVDYLFSDCESVKGYTDGTTVVRISFDRVQQNVTYAFPVVLLVRGGFTGPIRYRITADELPAVVGGELSMSAE